jgi:hypothetical protein
VLWGGCSTTDGRDRDVAARDSFVFVAVADIDGENKVRMAIAAVADATLLMKPRRSIILTSRCCACDGEAATPLMAAVEPSQTTNDVNSFATRRRRSCDGRGDCSPLQLIKGQQTRRGDKGRC